MDAITTYDIDTVIRQMRSKRNFAPATLKHVLVLIRRVYNWASEMELYRGENPAQRIKLPTLNNEVTECLSKAEIKDLMSTLDQWRNQRIALLVRFALFTGLRRGELFSMQWKHVDLLKGWIFLTDTKGGKDNVLPLSDKAVDVLRKAKDLLPVPDCPLVFPNRTGNQRTTIGNTWTRIKKSANIPAEFRFHGLRHTFASYLASSGKVSQYTLQKLLTHKSPQMTQRYAHLFDETLREGANVMSSLI
jgi:integrase